MHACGDITVPEQDVTSVPLRRIFWKEKTKHFTLLASVRPEEEVSNSDSSTILNMRPTPSVYEVLLIMLTFNLKTRLPKNKIK